MNIKDKWLIGILIVFTLFNLRLSSKNNKTDETIDLFRDYLVDVDKGGKKTVVILVTGTAYVDKEPVEFVDAKPLEIAKRELKRAGYTVITLTTPCAIRCLDDYAELGLLILDLEADAVIYKGIHSDFGTDTLNRILEKGGVPIYSYGSEVVLNYRLYTGPDNKGMARAIRVGLEKIAKEGERVIYIETITKLNNDTLDNGYQRILAVQKELASIGLVEVESVATLWNRARTFEEISRVLNQKGKVDYIIAPSIGTALGAAEAVERLGYKGQIKIIAMDFTKEGVQLLKEGKFYGLVSQSLEEQGLAIARGIINNNLLPGTKKLFSSDTLITLENLNDYELTKGNYRW